MYPRRPSLPCRGRKTSFAARIRCLTRSHGTSCRVAEDWFAPEHPFVQCSVFNPADKVLLYDQKKSPLCQITTEQEAEHIGTQPPPRVRIQILLTQKQKRTLQSS